MFEEVDHDLNIEQYIHVLNTTECLKICTILTKKTIICYINKIKKNLHKSLYNYNLNLENNSLKFVCS